MALNEWSLRRAGLQGIPSKRSPPTTVAFGRASWRHGRARGVMLEHHNVMVEHHGEMVEHRGLIVEHRGFMVEHCRLMVEHRSVMV